jgi:integrase/recombinase XerD
VIESRIYSRNPIAHNVAGGGSVHARDTDWQVYDTTGRRKYLSAAERARFLDRAATLPEGPRALCRLLAFTGCRVSEALSLGPYHVDPERCTVTFLTLKRRRTTFRSVPVPAELCSELLALRGTSERLWTMHRTTAWRYVRALARQAQIEGPMACPRGLRHGFGIHAATCNVPQNLIQRWMGHASIVTTSVYLDAVGVEETGFASRMWN